MTDLVEHVAISTFHAECEPHMAETGYGTRFAWDDAMPQVQQRHNAIARAAIISTLQWARDNVSQGMAYSAVDECPLRYFRQTVDRGLGAGYQRCSIDSDDAATVFRAMIDALLQEMGGGKT